jgi:hypothetical protein
MSMTENEGSVRAQIGDRIVLRGMHVRDGEVLEVRGPNGEPPFVVRWHDDEHEVLFFPGSESIVERSERPET